MRPWHIGAVASWGKKWPSGECSKPYTNIYCYKQIDNIFVKPETTNISWTTLNYCELVTRREIFIFWIISYSVAVFG
jgi:hypothetical protein